MKIRDDVLVSQDDMGTSGTKIYNLDYADPISGLDLLIEATNGATDNKNNPIERNVSKIEIVDGGEVLWELPGDVAYALFSQLNGAPPHEYHTGATSDTPYVTIPVRFGRELYDPELALAPRNFRNPQLKITFNEATVNAAGATGFVSDSFNLTILAHLMEEAPAPGGYLMCKDIKEFTSLASGDDTVDMPVDHPWRLLMVRAYEAGVDFRSSISNYKLSCDGGKFIPFDSHVRSLMDRMAEIFRPTWKAGYDVGDDGDTFQTWIGLDIGQAIHSHTASKIVTASSFWPGQFTVNVYTDAGVAANDCTQHWKCDGWCPHNLLLIPFGRLHVLGEYFNAPQYGTVKLYLTQGNEGAEVNVCLQQYRTY